MTYSRDTKRKLLARVYEGGCPCVIQGCFKGSMVRQAPRHILIGRGEA
jgi:hypothetical protein